MRTKVLLVMDVVESVRLMDEDEEGTVQRWQGFVGHVLHQVLPRHGGRMVKSLGDGLMLEFGTAQECVAAAFAIEEHSREINTELPGSRKMHLRMGAHIAGFVTDEHDIYGSDVNLAVRLTTITKPGELVASAELRELLVPTIDADIEDLGECFLKHISKPVRAYRITPSQPHRAEVALDTPPAELRPTIAVVPFEMRSGEPQHELLGEALADELIGALSRTSELRVISRLSTAAFRGRNDLVNAIRTHLGADYALSGICRSLGGKLSLFVELIDVKTGHVAWADNLKGDYRSLFSIESELITGIVASISSAVMVHQLHRARGRTLPTMESYALLLGAITLMHRLSRNDFERSRAMLEVLIERVPREPVPRAWLARWHAMRPSQGWSSDARKDALLALDCTKRALDADPDCGLALTIDGLVHTHLLMDHEIASKRYAQALEVNPNEPFAWLHSGTLHAFKGEGKEAVIQTERALSLSPLDPLKYYFESLAATAAMAAQQYERAVELGKRSLRGNRSHTSTLRALAISQVQLGQIDEARQSARHLLQLDPSFSVSQFRARSPSSNYPLGELCAQAFLQAGVPQ